MKNNPGNIFIHFDILRNHRSIFNDHYESANNEIISLPQWLMTSLNLRDGDKIKPVVEGHTLRLNKLDQFLSLKAVLKDNDEFDSAIENLR